MDIAINNIVDHQSDRTVYWTLTDDATEEYQWHSDIPKGGEAQDHLDRVMPRYLLSIRNQEYSTLKLGRDYIIDSDQSQLEAIEEWIADGQMLRDDGGQYTERLDPLPWVSTHPGPDPLDDNIIDRRKLSEQAKTALNACSSTGQIVSWLKDVFDVQ